MGTETRLQVDGLGRGNWEGWDTVGRKLGRMDGSRKLERMDGLDTVGRMDGLDTVPRTGRLVIGFLVIGKGLLVIGKDRLVRVGRKREIIDRKN